jgi:hypothetical protein
MIKKLVAVAVALAVALVALIAFVNRGDAIGTGIDLLAISALGTILLSGNRSKR